MNPDFWNNRYSERQFAYGILPNEFFKTQIDQLKPGKALFLGEGEGRNSIYAAKLGWYVDAVDFSSSAKEKALLLAEQSNVNINYIIADLDKYIFEKNLYDLVVMIFLHLPESINVKVFKGSISSLKSGGKMIIETFSKDQAKNSSGGPKNKELLFSEDELIKLTDGLRISFLKSQTIQLDEGTYHRGKADVIRFLGEKT